MNDINLNNYIERQKRYITGGLTNDEEALFEQFLMEHPELMDDVLENGQKLEAPVVTFEGKNSLKKEPSAIDGLPMFDFLAIKKSETGLDDKEQLQLQAYIANNPALKQDVEAYANAKLRADSNVVFPHKSALKRQTLGGAFLIRTLKYTSAAAAVAALVYFSWPASQQSVGPQTAMVQVEKQGDETKPDAQPAPRPEKQKTDSIAAPKTRKAKSAPAMEMPSLEPNERLLAAMQPKAAEGAIYQQQVNAYEVGLNVMMPQYLDNQIEINKLMALTMPDATKTSQMQRATLPVNMVEGGVKVFNFLGIRKMSVDKFYDEDGNLVAYKVKGESMEWSRKVKQP